MKISKYIPVWGLMALVMSACESDLDKTIYDESKVKPAVISGIESSYVLDASKGNENALQVTWSEPDMTYQAAVTSMLQMDLTDKNFEKPVTLSSSNTETSYQATVSDFNKLIMNLLKKYDTEYTEGDVKLSFRIGSYISTTVDTVFSEVVSTTVTPYVGEAVYPMISVRGAYSGWDFDDGQFVYSSNSDDNYSAMIYFDVTSKVAANPEYINEWKFCLDPDWKTNWGADGKIAPEAAKAVLKSSGGNITAYTKNSYFVEFNTSDLTLKMSQGYDSWGIVGDNNGWGTASDDTKMAYGKDEDGAYLMATVEFTGDKFTWKIRPDSKWENDRNTGNTAYEGDVEDAGADGNFKMSKGAGSYEVKWYFNKVQQKLVVTKK